MKIDTTLSKKEYGFVRILKALANENRFIIFKNLQNGECYATELSGPLKISRPALGKHVRILIKEGLVEKKHVVEGGTAKTVYELTDFGEKIAGKINGFTKDVEAITSLINREFREELMDIDAQIKSTNAIIKGIKTRFKNEEISSKEYKSLKSDYEERLNKLRKKRNEIKGRLNL